MNEPSLFLDCPHCGAILKKTATHCPFCGADEKTAWSEENRHILPEEDYAPPKKKTIAFYKIIAILLIIAMFGVYIL